MISRLLLSLKKTVLPIYIYMFYPIAKRLLKDYDILNSVETVYKIKNGNLSISRFGDGEYEILRRRGTGFQKADEKLATKLEFILHNPIDSLLICIPYALSTLDIFRPSSKRVWRSFICRNLRVVTRNTLKNYTYGDSLCTRFYMPLADKSKSMQVANLLKTLWAGRKVCIIEGEGTRLGVGNDLLLECIEVVRIICPSNNAFSKYDVIRNTINKDIPKDVLLLIALGMTATVLSYDLTIDGYQALDIGHIDVEYEWMRMGAIEKCSVQGRAVNELGNNNIEYIANSEYENQIITRIL